MIHPFIFDLFKRIVELQHPPGGKGYIGGNLNAPGNSTQRVVPAQDKRQSVAVCYVFNKPVKIVVIEFDIQPEFIK